MSYSVLFVSFVLKYHKIALTETGWESGGFSRWGGLLGLIVAGSRPKLPALKGT